MTDVQALMSKESEQLFNMYKDKVNAEKFGGGVSPDQIKHGGSLCGTRNDGSRLPERICPVCGKTYRDYPALSREDNQTEICPDCGIIQSLKACGADDATIQSVLQTIHASSAE